MKLEKKKKKKVSIKDFFAEIKKISLFGWILIILMLVLNAGNSFISARNDEISNEQYATDTIHFKTIIEKLENKRQNDSTRIKELENVLKVNGQKSDSIKVQLVDNAIKALKEQKAAIENERENIFIHMKNEVKDNLRKIYLNFRKDHILGFIDTPFFVSTRLNNVYINKYQSFSTSPIIIDHLMETSESISFVNKYAEFCSIKNEEINGRKTNINMFLKNVKTSENYLISIYRRINNLKSYKQYEKIDFSRETKELDLDSLKVILQNDHYYKTSSIKK
ncbi:hypothetical protein [Tenacibaculum larymnensis]|uniref:Uncharacterized protein n=1 Tax=Tenacibaculum larymnensis TaxID=2878201 RepID=A0A9X4EMF6_9FLAO|nr:hypothetical protein [Tenacibaculum larymnensis]MDE1206608.1 hypothetical protein [Tenacibaculum larymnensis]